MTSARRRRYDGRRAARAAIRAAGAGRGSLLVVSLALNALLVGVVMRGLWTIRANIAMTGGAIESTLPAFVNTLPADRREELAQRCGRPARQRFGRLRMELRRARDEAARAFVADPFDKQAFIAAQSRLFEAESDLRLSIQRMLPDIGERMTASERRAYLNWRGHGRGGPGGFRRGGQGQRGGPGFDGDEVGPGATAARVSAGAAGSIKGTCPRPNSSRHAAHRDTLSSPPHP